MHLSIATFSQRHCTDLRTSVAHSNAHAAQLSSQKRRTNALPGCPVGLYGLDPLYTSAGIASCYSRHVRPSVRLFETLRYCIKTNKVSVMISSPMESPNTLVSAHIRFIPKPVTPSEGVKWHWGRYELAFFVLYATISPKQCKIGPRLLSITNISRIHASGCRLVPKSTTLVDPLCTLIHYRHVFWSPPLKSEWR